MFFGSRKDGALLFSTNGKGNWKLDKEGFQSLSSVSPRDQPYVLHETPAGQIFLQSPDSLIDLAAGRSFVLPPSSDVMVLGTRAWILLNNFNFDLSGRRDTPSVIWICGPEP